MADYKRAEKNRRSRYSKVSIGAPLACLIIIPFCPFISVSHGMDDDLFWNWLRSDPCIYRLNAIKFLLWFIMGVVFIMSGSLVLKRQWIKKWHSTSSPLLILFSGRKCSRIFLFIIHKNHEMIFSALTVGWTTGPNIILYGHIGRAVLTVTQISRMLS